MSETRLEKVWFYHKNKQLQDKRRDEETLAFLREWRIAKGRMDAEIQRRKEHLNEATDFEKARGFVRTCWKTKNWNPDDDPTQFDSSTDSEDVADQNEEEMRDRVDSGSIKSPTESPARKSIKSSIIGGADMSQSMNSERKFMSDSKQRRKTFSQRPEVIDVSAVQVEHSSALSTREQIDTLNAIKDYNKSLPLKRRAKDSLPEIKTFNVAKIHRVVKDYKKDKTELDPLYKPIGNNDDGETNAFNNDKFSLSAKTRAIQRSQSQQRIDYIRTSYANLLGLTPKEKPVEAPPPTAPEGTKKKAKGLGQPVPKQLDGFTNVFKKQDVDNPFTKENWKNTISLSVYNRPQFMADRRPLTAKTTEDLVKRLPGWKPMEKKAETGPDGEPLPPPPEEPEREPVLPLFETPF